MMPRLVKMLIIPVLLLCVVGSEAVAWGPEAQRGIITLALQMVRRDYPGAFKTVDTSYEQDIYRGMQEGIKVLRTTMAINSDDQGLQAVDSEIQLLREARMYSKGSYFAYRMGVLATLASDLIMPYGLAQSGQEASMKARIESDIDKHYQSYIFSPGDHPSVFIRSINKYFNEKRMFIEDSKSMITNDYNSGVGYDGYLRQGGKVIFGRAVEAVADVWTTALRSEGSARKTPPSKPVLTWYFVGQLEYLLTVKKSFYVARDHYEHFKKVNPGIPESYEKVGDLFYSYGTEESRKRGVEEWQKAYNYSVPKSLRPARKLSQHYIAVGKVFLNAASKPGAEPTCLPNALSCFTRAQEYDTKSKEAAKLVNKTNIEIREKQERYELALKLIGQADTVIGQADRLKIEMNYGSAMARYNQGQVLYELIDEEFSDLKATSTQGAKQASKKIREVIDAILTMGENMITSGDQAKNAHNYDEAVQLYEQVEKVVNLITNDSDAIYVTQKQDIISRAAGLIDQAKTEKVEYEARKAREDAERASGKKASGKSAAPSKGSARPSARKGGRAARGGRGRPGRR